MSPLNPLTMRRILLLGFALGFLVIPAACHNEMDFGTGDSADPSCQLLNGALDFGTLTADGSFADRTFSIRNIGGGVLTGTVRVDSPGMSIVSGGGFYSLGPGRLRRVVVRFRPGAPGDFSGQVAVGNLCRAATFQAQAIASIVCNVSPLDIDFGTVQTGGPFVDRTFTITNPGSTPLTGRVSGSCDAFSIISGAGDYSLAAGQTRTVTVRFQPGTAGNQDCLIETGAASCGDVRAFGLAENPPVCEVSPVRFDFGTVNIGFAASTDFTLTNNGGGTLSGVVSESCPAFNLTSGGGAYSLGPGESRTVSVRFEPADAGPDSCVIDLGGAGCVGPVFVGRGERLPLCSLSATTLDFGTVVQGGGRDLTFTITNAGGGSLTGAIAENCADFSVTSGGGAFSLAGGASREVTVRFEPSAPGPASCTIATGIESCPAIDASGAGEASAGCDVTPSAIVMGPVVVGSSADTTFTLANSGGGTLSGTITENCADFSITGGGGAFSLGSGAQRTVSVRFEPASAGNKSCTIDFGTTLCTGLSMSGAAQPPPQCVVSPTDLAFGNVGVGSSSEKNFTITNSGGGILTGTVSASCPGYSIVAGGGGFSLGSNEVRTVTVHFEPQTVATLNCTIGLGTADCPGVNATGAGVASSCQITPLSLTFGNVQVGTTASRTFTIKNNGATPISGNVTLACDAFSFQSGDGAFTLSTGQQKNVTVLFSPTAVQNYACTIETGTIACADVNATGTGEPPPTCEVTPLSIPFGTVVVGNSLDRTFTIRNSGGGVLTGSVSLSCPGFQILTGGGGFSLTAGASKTVTIRFAPLAGGPFSCTVSTGTNCPGVDLTGTGEPAPVCSISTASLDFGTVAVGGFADTSFTITNTGGSTLNGNVSSGCSDFSITSGAGAFSLTNQQSRTVTVRFQPQTGGIKNCSINLGTTLCGSVSASGTGDAPPECLLSATTLSFGNVTVNTTAERSFTITNTGGQSLAGNVTASCQEFSITAGGGAFSLTAGQLRTVTVRFAPTTAGTNKTCTIQTGTGLCGTVAASGNGVQPPACQLSATSLDFGLVTADGSTFLNQSFTISNTGGGVLNGTVSLSGSCPGYSIVSGQGSYSLNGGQSKTITVRFQPASGAFGTFTCSIDVGNTSCGGPVSATGIGAVSFAAHVEPLISVSCAVSNCHNGTNSLPDFRIYANASSPIYVSTSTPTSSLLLLKPANQPNPDGLHGGGLIAGWGIGAPNYNTTLLWIQQAGLQPGLRP